MVIFQLSTSLKICNERLRLEDGLTDFSKFDSAYEWLKTGRGGLKCLLQEKKVSLQVPTILPSHLYQRSRIFA